MASTCPQLLTNGTCSNSSCVYLHDLSFCDTCGIGIVPGTEVAHSKTKQHLSRADHKFIYCNICDTGILALNWKAHTSGNPHVRAASRKGVSPAVGRGGPIVTDFEGYRYCKLCRIHVSDDGWTIHTRGRTHIATEKLTAFQALRDDAESDKNGITIEGTSNFDIIDPTDSSMGTSMDLVIGMPVPHSKVKLVEISDKGNRHSPFTVAIQGPHRTVLHGKPIIVTITFRQSHVGRYEDRVEFLFEDSESRKRFLISRTLRATVGNKADHELLRPQAPYVPRARTIRQPKVTVVAGVSPPSLKALSYVSRLPLAQIPPSLFSALSRITTLSVGIGWIKKGFMPRKLDSNTYSSYFKYLLWIEEFQMNRDMERYDLSNTTLAKQQSYYYLKVPGLAEKRPSVLVGDSILVQKQGETNGRWYDGRVHVLREEDVGLQFHGSFDWNATQRYNVQFKLNRMPMRRQHQAIDSPFSNVRVFFPPESLLPRTSYATKHIQLFNPLLEDNRPQLQAVNAIMGQAPGSVPFVIFGPPGTGKTMTVIEAIQQVLKSNPNAKVLACTPSNSAADLIAIRLHALNPKELFRLYAPSRLKNQVPKELLSYTHIGADGHFFVPTLETMKQFRVVVTTCMSASIISGIGMPRAHYSHIFVDEAGQATEPEVALSIKTLADNNTNIVLSGDPKQLGPIVRSGIACELGLEKSYIERLMSTAVYDIRKRSGLSVVKLTRNYRSHNAILKFPNETFYDGDLQQCSDPDAINSYLGASYLPEKKFPVVFHGVAGMDDREASSPSFFNIDEITQVRTYVKALLADRRRRTTVDDIGIITPYHAQCLKIRKTLRGIADGIKVGSVEEFQGQERRVIIISTVRSSRELIEYDLRHTLGFVASPRRLNVAVTRAKALLIIIGDPEVLSLDPLWRSFLNYIYEKKGWTGYPITWDPRAPVEQGGGYDRKIREAAEVDMNDFARKLEALTLENVDYDEGADDRRWGDVE